MQLMLTCYRSALSTCAFQIIVPTALSLIEIWLGTGRRSMKENKVLTIWREVICRTGRRISCTHFGGVTLVVFRRSADLRRRCKSTLIGTTRTAVGIADGSVAKFASGNITTSRV
jgi:hypothetical protein